jgi:hypothetical protein
VTGSTLDYDDMREARRQILAVQDPQAQTALFTLLGLLDKVAEDLERRKAPINP